MDVCEAGSQRRLLRPWALAIICVTLGVWDAEAPAATVSSHPFGRYEILLQEGIGVEAGEIVGMVRRQTGLPEYPLIFGVGRGGLDLNILGPGNRPHRLASAGGPGSAMVRKAPLRFMLERSAMHGESLVLRVRQPGVPQRMTLRVNLARLGRMLEGER